MPRPDAPTTKNSCTTCLYFCVAALVVAAFFAGAWTDGLVARRSVQSEPVVQENTPQVSATAVGAVSQATTTAPQLMDTLDSANASPSPVYLPPPMTQTQAIKPGAKQCTVTSICGGKDRNGDGTGDDVMVRDSACKEAPAGTTCQYGCSYGTCRPQPGGTAQISVSPSRVHAGETVTVSWVAKGMIADSCSVKNLSQMIDDQWKGDEGSKTSSPIKERTPYLLTCAEPSGVPYSTSATVELLK